MCVKVSRVCFVVCKRNRRGRKEERKGKKKEERRREKERERCAHVYAVTRVYIHSDGPVKDPGGEREERDNARRRLVVGVVWMQ